MKIIYTPALFACLLSVASAYSQTVSSSIDSFQLTGTIKGMDSGNIILQYPDRTGTYRNNKVPVNKGSFEFKGALTEPIFTWLYDPQHPNNSINFFMERGKQHITVTDL